MANPFAIDFQQAPILEGLFQGIGQAQAEDKANLANMFQQLQNERYAQATPYELQQKQLEGARAQQMMSPEMLDLYKRGYGGQMKSQIAAGDMASALYPFKLSAEQARLESEGGTDTLFAKFAKNTQIQFDKSKPEAERIAAAQENIALGEALKNTPKFLGQKQLQEEKLDAMLEAARLKAEREAANKASAADKIYQTWIKLPPRTRLAQIAAALSTGINPFTQDPLTERDRAYLEKQLEQDTKLINAELNAKNQGATTVEGNKLVPVPPVNVGVSTGPAAGTKENPIKID